MGTVWDDLLTRFCALFPPGTFLSFEFNVQALIAIVLVSVVCGAVGSLVVGNRMAFFSDALAHSAFAGVGLGLLLGLLTGAEGSHFPPWLMAVVVGWGVLIGLAIAFVRERTGQASDTVIGVFFAGSIGLGAVLLKLGSTRSYLPPEDFLFGRLLNVTSADLLILLVLLLVTSAVLAWYYNQMVFTSFSPPLARSRQVSVRLCNYLFIALLAVIVNVCLKAVGVLLINALLIVPAATAANTCRNMRQLFWWSIALCVTAGAAGQWLSWEVTLATRPLVGAELHLPESGTIVIFSVSLFFLSLLWKEVRDRLHTPAPAPPKP